MAIEFTCPECAGRLRVEDGAAGQQVRCGGCRTIVRVPEPPADPPATPPAAIPVAPPEPAHAEPPLFEQGDPYPEDERRPKRRRADEDEDEDDRRREYDDEPPRRPRRRRRPPPAPQGRGALFWIMVVFGVLIIGTCACCGGGYLIIPGENWKRHESPAGGFSVELPAPVRKDMPIPGMKPDPNLKVEGTIFWKRGEIYIVSYMDLPAADDRGQAAEVILDEVVKEMKSDPEIKRVVRNERIKVSGFPAREIEYVYEDGGTYMGRVIVTNHRMYMIVGGGRFVGPGNANIRRFLDSFKITGPPR